MLSGPVFAQWDELSNPRFNCDTFNEIVEAFGGKPLLSATSGDVQVIISTVGFLSMLDAGVFGGECSDFTEEDADSLSLLGITSVQSESSDETRAIDRLTVPTNVNTETEFLMNNGCTVTWREAPDVSAILYATEDNDNISAELLDSESNRIETETLVPEAGFTAYVTAVFTAGEKYIVRFEYEGTLSEVSFVSDHNYASGVMIDC